jgi:hypothetical protein
VLVEQIVNAEIQTEQPLLPAESTEVAELTNEEETTSDEVEEIPQLDCYFKLIGEAEKPNGGLDLVSFVFFLVLFDTTMATRKSHLNADEFYKVIDLSSLIGRSQNVSLFLRMI